MATVIVKVVVLMIWAKLELLEVVLVPVVPLEAVLDAVLEAVLDPDDELPDEASLDEDPAWTDCPGVRSSSEAIVPVAGARSVASESATSSLFRVCSSCSTASSSASTVVVVDEEEESSASDSVSCAAVSVAFA
jgi:hypothetical protein